MITRFVHPIVLFHFIISIYLICQFHVIPCDLREHIKLKPYKLGFGNIPLKQPQIRVLIRFQSFVTFLAFAIQPIYHRAIHHHEICHHLSSLVQSEISAVLIPSFLAVQTLSAVSGESKALFRAIIFNILEKYFGDILQWIKRNCAILPDQCLFYK